MLKGYEMVIGLEVHVELKTKTKIFCSCKTDFGAAPNTQVCPVCLGLPGTLPVLNQEAVRYAVKAGLATHCEISSYSKQDRKNYFYPDLPKAYQISQYDLPLCQGGYLMIETPAGEKRIGITRIHIEEDAGKLIHDSQKGTLIDCNRCGVPLIEIVSEPDIRTSQEAAAYLQKLRAIISYSGISDCKMNEGSMRCDVNLSVRKPGEPMGTRTEMKNLNSFQSVIKAIEYEYARQVEAVEDGRPILQETRRFDQPTGKTFSMRLKEDADDYRYFPDPDLPPIAIPPEEIARLKAEIPPLPDERKARYIKAWGLTPYAAEQLTSQREIADYFETAAQGLSPEEARTLGNLLQSQVFRLLLPESSLIPIAPPHLREIARMLARGEINSTTGKKAVAALWEADQDPRAYVAAGGLYQINDATVLTAALQDALRENPKLAADYFAGKERLGQAIIGIAMGKTQGKANPVKLQALLQGFALDPSAEEAQGRQPRRERV